MDVLLIFLTVFVTLIASLCTALLAPLRQLRSRVDPSYFKRVKVPYPVSYLFVGIGGKRSKTGDVSKYGVISPMFVLHILGYLLTLFIWAIVPVAYQFGPIDLDVLFVIPLAVAVFDVIVVVLTEVICVAYVKRKQLEASYEEDFIEDAPVVPVAPAKKANVAKVEKEPIAEQSIETESVVEEAQPEEKQSVEESAVEEVQPVEEQSVEEVAVEQAVEPIAEEPQPVVEEHAEAEPEEVVVADVEQPVEEPQVAEQVDQAPAEEVSEPASEETTETPAEEDQPKKVEDPTDPE